MGAAIATGLAALSRLAAASGIALRDQPRAAMAADIDPQPVECDGEPVAQADQEEDVGDAPDPPGQAPAQLDPAEIDDGRALADRREIAGIPLGEGRRSQLALQPRLDEIGDMASLLLGGGRDAGHRLAIGAGDEGGIADHEDIGLARHREIGLDTEAPRTIGRGFKPFRRR